VSIVGAFRSNSSGRLARRRGADAARSHSRTCRRPGAALDGVGWDAGFVRRLPRFAISNFVEQLLQINRGLFLKLLQDPGSRGSGLPNATR